MNQNLLKGLNLRPEKKRYICLKILALLILLLLTYNGGKKVVYRENIKHQVMYRGKNGNAYWRNEFFRVGIDKRELKNEDR